MPSPVIDLSHHNPTPDWPTLKQSGVMAVMLKCTQNVGYLDPTYATRSTAAKEAGLLVAPYHFLQGGQIKRQMDWFLDKANIPKGGRAIIDHEADATLDELCDAVAALWDKRPDLQITIYSGHTIKDQLGSTLVCGALKNTSLWIAHYTTARAPIWPTQQWPNWSLWQWTDKETVPGIAKPVDGNKWNGSADSLRAFMSPASDKPATPQADRPVIKITVPDGVKLEINGVQWP